MCGTALGVGGAASSATLLAGGAAVAALEAAGAVGLAIAAAPLIGPAAIAVSVAAGTAYLMYSSRNYWLGLTDKPTAVPGAVENAAAQLGVACKQLVEDARAKLGVDCENSYNFAVVGKVKEGKSSLVNALRGVQCDAPGTHSCAFCRKRM